MIKLVTTEKAVKLIEMENTLIAEVGRKDNKGSVAKEFADVFNVKVENVRTLIRKNKKYAYIKLKKENLAIDVATKLGMI